MKHLIAAMDLPMAAVTFAVFYGLWKLAGMTWYDALAISWLVPFVWYNAKPHWTFYRLQQRINALDIRSPRVPRSAPSRH
jgi:hypothetical protein